MQKLHNRSDNPETEKRLQEILGTLYSFYSQKIDMSLERVERFLHQLGDPHLKLPPVVHVAGTNGKGSTIAILRSLLEAHEKKVHVMTSPHLVHPTERVRLAAELISSDYLIELLEECLAVNRSEPITFFEMFTAATYLAFSRAEADICLLETGMGGRLDATNVIPDPICTIITTISKDHEKFLGDTLDKIAFEKAGIIKENVPCVIGYQTLEALEANVISVFEKQANALKAPLSLFDQDWHCHEKNHEQNNEMIFSSNDNDWAFSLPNLVGPHQVYNAGAALKAFEIIHQSFDTEKINEALTSIHWPGRLQKIEHELLPKNWELFLDGGHNDSAGQFSAQQAMIWRDSDQKELHLIVAMVDRKNPKEFLTPLLPHTKTITLMEIIGEETSFDLKKLEEIAKNIGFQSISRATSFDQAIKNVTQSADEGRILATGSLYFLGNIFK
ncbi:MAG: folylpolyglutamate synthase/dihydrofolate synthase family protein [Pseudomonadota bacterium]